MENEKRARSSEIGYTTVYLHMFVPSSHIYGFLLYGVHSSCCERNFSV